MRELDESFVTRGAEYSLATHQWMSGAIDPKGFLNIESFRLEGMMPVWSYALADGLLEKRVWMKHGENTTYVQYTLVRGTAPAEVSLKALVNYRDYHAATHAGDWRMQIDGGDGQHGVKVTAFDGATPFFLKCAGASCEARHEWYRDCFMAVEKERGLDDHEDRLFAALFRTTLNVGGDDHVCGDDRSGCGANAAALPLRRNERMRSIAIGRFLSRGEHKTEKTRSTYPNWAAAADPCGRSIYCEAQSCRRIPTGAASSRGITGLAIGGATR